MTGVELLQQALAARTTPGRLSAFPKTFAEIEAVIQQVRQKVCVEFVADGIGHAYQRGEGKAVRRKEREAAKRGPGRGWRECPWCHASVGIASKKCARCAGVIR